MIVALCGLSAMLGWRLGRSERPDPSGIVAQWAETYREETGRSGPCEGRPEGTGFVISCGGEANRVDYRTDGWGRLVARHAGALDG
ncbi:hypothetical protein [Maritimibacter sp. DP1N21-5]|uniref:hypothetical protein n=1 Tax=Maritimibacter sp. DP1N21-5 TaxID=2836867 RepID=UPI001C456536|nr:hypothetical protein [Maritimibacter sp. DP1N21-5]MBV7409434.1 hypothetical protein [Maritimibacter sp. DP1N21-5]